MKRKLFFGCTFLFLTWAFTSCEALNTCKICRQVTYINGLVDQEGPETEYCDAKLIAIEATPDVINGNTRIAWECR
ncbi:MAG TPA: hypothetical protein VMW32_10745 [Bacteroidales bacterium]|nr:hypothetical protein [Bacteroidales bacterium]